MSRFRPPRGSLLIALAFWLAAVIAGFTYVVDYELTSKAAGWHADVPSEAGIHLDRELPTLLLFVHPKCPCTRATMEELNRIMASCDGRLTARVFAYQPERAAEEWHVTDVWRSAVEIPGVRTQVDIDGKMALAFGVSTSGHAMLYSTGGELLFTGGITASRGHSGDNLGRKAILDVVLRGSFVRCSAPVFGCSIRGEKGD
jgi:hypothetical protein